MITNVLSFEPSGVVFSNDDVYRELNSGDFITVTTPTLMTWNADSRLNADNLSKALSVVSKDKEGDDWEACQYGQGFNGIIDISEKKKDTRIVAKYIIKHFTLVNIVKKKLGWEETKKVYAVCVLSKQEMNLKDYKISCCICHENPEKDSQLGEKFLISSEPILYDSTSNLKVAFLFTKFDYVETQYSLEPIEHDLKVALEEVHLIQKFRNASYSSTGCGSYRLKIGEEDHRVRARIQLIVNGKANSKLIWIFVPSPVE